VAVGSELAAAGIGILATRVVNWRRVRPHPLKRVGVLILGIGALVLMYGLMVARPSRLASESYKALQTGMTLPEMFGAIHGDWTCTARGPVTSEPLFEVQDNGAGSFHVRTNWMTIVQTCGSREEFADWLSADAEFSKSCRTLTLVYAPSHFAWSSSRVVLEAGIVTDSTHPDIAAGTGIGGAVIAAKQWAICIAGDDPDVTHVPKLKLEAGRRDGAILTYLGDSTNEYSVEDGEKWISFVEHHAAGLQRYRIWDFTFRGWGPSRHSFTVEMNAQGRIEKISEYATWD
jgi:hypothetical protein